MSRRLIAAVALLLAGESAHGALLCQKRSGALFVRTGCHKHETAVDLTSVGVAAKGDPGPKGDPGEARAYGCSNASGDGTLVAPCPDRPSKNIVSIVGSTMSDGITCFVLDPSITASSATVLASFNGNISYGTSVNVVLFASGEANLYGCPPNSVAVFTARYNYFGGTPMFTPIRLAVNVAVM